MALHPSDQQIVLKTDFDQGSFSTEHILKCILYIFYVSCLDSFSYSNSVSEQSSGDTYISANRETPTNLGIPEFPSASTEAGQYYQSVLLAVERWFSLYGWPSGPHPISIPHTLRRTNDTVPQLLYMTLKCICCIYYRSVVEMLHYLTDRQIPGIGLCQTFSSDIDQRTNQLLQQHEAMLAFLRVQGACLCHIRPEYLLDVLEFKHWCSLDTETGLYFNSFDFESLSKRCWTDVLLQIYKVKILPLSSLNTPLNITDTDDIPLDGSQSLVSNLYSPHELQLLSWLNRHYQKMRKTVWGTGKRIPSARWIVNFDLDFTDGLVLAALLAAYCPYLIKSHFQRIYTTVSSLEQIIHNNIIVSQALTTLGVNMDIQVNTRGVSIKVRIPANKYEITIFEGCFICIKSFFNK
uniref:Calponin-homology (CH) domain-containing protein n=1 Tax=Kryptolebias marmoratus TaxID=37003 RepID=A0A3Q2ZBY2_KRYMA